MTSNTTLKAACKASVGMSKAGNYDEEELNKDSIKNLGPVPRPEDNPLYRAPEYGSPEHKFYRDYINNPARKAQDRLLPKLKAVRPPMPPQERIRHSWSPYRAAEKERDKVSKEVGQFVKDMVDPKLQSEFWDSGTGILDLLTRDGGVAFGQWLERNPAVHHAVAAPSSVTNNIGQGLYRGFIESPAFVGIYSNPAGWIADVRDGKPIGTTNLENARKFREWSNDFINNKSGLGLGEHEKLWRKGKWGTRLFDWGSTGIQLGTNMWAMSRLAGGRVPKATLAANPRWYSPIENTAQMYYTRNPYAWGDETLNMVDGGVAQAEVNQHMELAKAEEQQRKRHDNMINAHLKRLAESNTWRTKSDNTARWIARNWGISEDTAKQWVNGVIKEYEQSALDAPHVSTTPNEAPGNVFRRSE